MRPKMIAGTLVFVVFGIMGNLIPSHDIYGGIIFAAGAQTAVSPQPQGQTSSKASSPADYSQEPFVYEQVLGKMRFESDGKGTREVFARLHVQTPAGLARAGQLVFDYNAATQRIEIRSVRVIKADGAVVRAGPNAVQDLSSPVTREAPIYTDMRQQHVTVPGLAVGDYLEYDVVITTFQALLPGQFWETWDFVDGAICLDEEVDLNVPRARSLKLKSPAGVSPSVHEEGDRHIYHWATSTLSYSSPNPLPANAKFDVKALLQGVRAVPNRSIRFSTFQTWGQVGAWYAHLEHDRRVPTPEIRALADQIVRGRTTDIEKVQALYRWVSTNIRYVSLSFGVGWYQPHTAADVLQNRYGDCKDKTTLLEALLEAEGFHGSPVLVNAMTDIDRDVPTPHQFDHVITRVSVAGRDYWLDTTTGVGPFGYLLPQLRGKSALVASADVASGLQNTPEALPDTTLYKIGVQGTVSEDRTLKAKLSFDTRGDLEVLLRLGLLQMSPTQMTSLIQNAARNSAQQNNLSITNLKAGDPTDTQVPFHLELQLQGTSQRKDQENAASSANPMDQVAQLKDAIVYLLPTAQEKTDSSGKLAPQAVKLQGPIEYVLSVDLTSEAWQAATIEKPIHIALSKDFAEFKADVAYEGQTIRASWDLFLRKQEVPAVEAKDYAAFVQGVTDALAKASSASGEPSAREIYQAGVRAFNQRNYSTAQQQFQKAVEKDPNSADAWNDLGRTYLNLGTLDKAAEAFQKAIAIAPDEKFAYNNLGLVFWRQQKYDEAIRSFQKQIEIVPNDLYSHKNLGMLYLERGENDLAQKELDTAASILGNDPELRIMLGRVYVRLNEPDKARQAFDRAVELSPTPLMWNDVSYYMADESFDLDRAQNYGESAVSATSAKLRAISLDHVSMADVVQSSTIVSYWDTLGWVYFRKGDLPKAEKYLQVAWMASQDVVIGEHLGEVYEKEDKKGKAMHQYALTLASRSFPQARERLAALSGTDEHIDNVVAIARPELTAVRMVTFANPAQVEGKAEFWLLFSSTDPTPQVQFISGDENMKAWAAKIQTAKYPEMFPDGTDTKLLRRGVLSCSKLTECTFVLMFVSDVRSVD